jgi:DNA-binding PadR family transcriptional regulator
MKRTHFNDFNHNDRFGKGAPRRDHGGHGRGHGFGPGFQNGFPGAFGQGFGPGFGPRGARRANKGDVRSALLSLLAEKPSNGYGLIKAIAERTSGAWRPSPGSVYPTLQQLVDEELIVQTGEGRSTEYDLSDAGRAYVEEHADELKQAWDATPGRTDAQTAFFESAGKLMGVVAQFRFSATDEQRAAAAEKLDEARRALYLILAD